MRKIVSLIVAVGIVFGFAAFGGAAATSFDFTGRVSSMDNSLAYNGLHVGDTFTGHFSYDSGATASATWSPPLYVYFLLGEPNSSSGVNLNGMVLEATSSYTIDLYDNGTDYIGSPPTSVFYDSINISASTNPGTAAVAGLYDWQLGFRNVGDSITASPLTSGSLPQAYALSDWHSYLGGSMLYQGPIGDTVSATSGMSFDILDISPSASVPEPTTLLFLGMSLLGLAGLRRLKK